MVSARPQTAKTGERREKIFLSFLFTGGKKEMKELLGGKVDIVQTFPASEGFFAFQDDFNKEGLLLQTNHGIFHRLKF